MATETYLAYLIIIRGKVIKIKIRFNMLNLYARNVFNPDSLKLGFICTERLVVRILGLILDW